MHKDLSGLFNPKSIAIVGASRDPQKVGAIVLKNIIMSGFKGTIYPINPSVDSVGEMKFYKSVNDLPEVPDLLIVAVPAKIANQILVEAGEKGIKNVLIFSAGYKEEGGAGIDLENELKEIAHKYQINLLGPNCLGFNNVGASINATFGANIENKGNLRIVSQSGAIATALVDWAQAVELGFDQLITLGNKTVLNENDVLEWWSQSTPSPSFDKEGGSCFPTGLYLESIADGKNFVKILKEYTKENPLFVLKPGKSAGAMKAMMSHTGSIAGEDNILEEALRESGAIRCSELSNFFDLSMAFSWGKEMNGPKIAVVTNAGGPAVLSTDTIESSGLELAQISEETRAKLADKLPRMASFMNPIDVLGDSLSARFGEVLEIVLQEKNVDAVVAILTPQLMTEIEKTAEIISFLASKYPQPIMCSFIGGSKTDKGEKIFNEKKIPNYNFPETAIYCLEKMWKWKKWKLETRNEKQEESNWKPATAGGLVTGNRIEEIIGEAKRNNQKMLNNFQSNTIMVSLGLATPLTEKVVGVAEAIEFSRKNGWPVVLKISGGDLLHKSEVGGVVTNIRSEYKLKKSFEKMNRDGFDMQIQQQIEGGVEVILGIKRDPNFGLVVLFGAGGKMAELIKDRNLRLFPLTEDKVKTMVYGSKVYTLLNGFRNDKVYDLNGLYQLIFLMEKLMTENSEIEEIEINPVIVTHTQAYCVDVKIKV